MSKTYEFADINGARVHYEARGAGPALVLIHAGICDLRMWDVQMDAFAQHFRVIRYDMRGFGQTAPVVGKYTRHGDLRGLLDHLGVESARVLGCSMGGMTAIDFALAYPERTAALITVCSSPSGYTRNVDPPPLWAEIVAADEAGDLEKVCELEVALWVDGLLRTPDQVDAAIRQRVYEMNLIALKNEALNMDDVERLEPPAIGRLGDIDAPTLAIAADLDMPDLLDAAELMATQIPRAQKVVMQGAAHLPNMEKPAEFNGVVLGFLGGV
ncbi:MAG: alpha/beta fold hydrolase [Caldilineaceae bacterium]